MSPRLAFRPTAPATALLIAGIDDCGHRLVDEHRHGLAVDRAGSDHRVGDGLVDAVGRVGGLVRVVGVAAAGGRGVGRDRAGRARGDGAAALERLGLRLRGQRHALLAVGERVRGRLVGVHVGVDDDLGLARAERLREQGRGRRGRGRVVLLVGGLLRGPRAAGGVSARGRPQQRPGRVGDRDLLVGQALDARGDQLGDALDRARVEVARSRTGAPTRSSSGCCRQTAGPAGWAARGSRWRSRCPGSARSSGRAGPRARAGR